MTWIHLVTLLLGMAASHLVTPEGVPAAAAAARAWETPPAPLYMQGDVSSHGNNNNNDNNKSPRQPQPGVPGLGQQQQQQARTQPVLQAHTRGGNTSGDGGGGGGGGGGETGGHDSGVVDSVLAALVDYSKDPELWRFVHSVVDELDFSRRASHPPAPAVPRPPRPALHLSRPHTAWRSTAAGEERESESRRHGCCGGSENHGGGNTSGHGRSTTTTTTTTTSTTTTAATPTVAAPQLPWLQQPPEQPPVSAERTRGSAPTDVLPVTPSDRVNFVKSQPSPSSHFLFHRVFVNETFDSHTRQPYRRPVLALTAVGKGAAKTDKGNLINSANQTRSESSHGAAAKELTDKYYSLAEAFMTPRHSGESRKGEEAMQEAGEQRGGGASVSRDVVSSTHHHHHRQHHRHHRLHTFKSQLRFLQRWEERLWRRSHFRLPRHTEGL